MSTIKTSGHTNPNELPHIFVVNEYLFVPCSVIQKLSLAGIDGNSCSDFSFLKIGMAFAHLCVNTIPQRPLTAELGCIVQVLSFPWNIISLGPETVAHLE